MRAARAAASPRTERRLAGNKAVETDGAAPTGHRVAVGRRGGRGSPTKARRRSPRVLHRSRGAVPGGGSTAAPRAAAPHPGARSAAMGSVRCPRSARCLVPCPCPTLVSPGPRAHQRRPAQLIDRAGGCGAVPPRQQPFIRAAVTSHHISTARSPTSRRSATCVPAAAPPAVPPPPPTPALRPALCPRPHVPLTVALGPPSPIPGAHRGTNTSCAFSSGWGRPRPDVHPKRGPFLCHPAAATATHGAAQGMRAVTSSTPQNAGMGMRMGGGAAQDAARPWAGSHAAPDVGSAPGCGQPRIDIPTNDSGA